MRIIRLAVLLCVVCFSQPSAQQETHDPQPCARTEGFTDSGARIHACVCHHHGIDDGEGCEALTHSEDRACAAFCRRDLCACPVICGLHEEP